MRKIQVEELKLIQLDILTGVDRFCRERGIKYALSGGTLLGAIRHGGYIPWDDDIDICMLREDFIRFEEEFPLVYDGHLCLASLKRRKDWAHAFAKVYDNRTVGYLKKYRNVSPGVNIDIFPIDDVPDDNAEWLQFNIKRRSLLTRLRHSSLKVSMTNTFFKNCGVILMNIRYLFVNRRELAERIDSFVQINNDKGFHRVFENTMGMYMKNNPFKKTIFNDIIDMPFENRVYKGFQNYDEYLTCAYGDYMTLPPLEQRISSHAVDFYWKE